MPPGTESSTTGPRNDHCSEIIFGGRGPGAVALFSTIASASRLNSCTKPDPYLGHTFTLAVSKRSYPMWYCCDACCAFIMLNVNCQLLKLRQKTPVMPTLTKKISGIRCEEPQTYVSAQAAFTALLFQQQCGAFPMDSSATA